MNEKNLNYPDRNPVRDKRTLIDFSSIFLTWPSESSGILSLRWLRNLDDFIDELHLLSRPSLRLTGSLMSAAESAVLLSSELCVFVLHSGPWHNSAFVSLLVQLTILFKRFTCHVVSLVQQVKKLAIVRVYEVTADFLRFFCCYQVLVLTLDFLSSSLDQSSSSFQL